MSDSRTIFVIDHCRDVRRAISEKLTVAGYSVLSFGAFPDFLRDDAGVAAACIIADISGDDAAIPLSEILSRSGGLPVIAMASEAGVSFVVQTMKAGAVDFLEKPVDELALLASVTRAIEIGNGVRGQVAQTRAAREAIASLTPREREVLKELVAGQSNKRAAATLGISARTVEIHRARIMAKTNARSFSGLVRLAFAAAKWDPGSREPAIAA